VWSGITSLGASGDDYDEGGSATLAGSMMPGCCPDGIKGRGGRGEREGVSGA